MIETRKHSATSNIIRILLRRIDTDDGITGLTSVSTGLKIGTIADNEAAAVSYGEAAGTVETITTLGTFAAPTASKCRFKEVDATNLPGLYELQIADARFAVASAKRLHIVIDGVTNLKTRHFVVEFSGITGAVPTLADVPTVIQIAAGVPTVAQIALGVLVYDWSTITTGSPPDRCLLNGTRMGCNKWYLSGATLSICEEDDTTVALSGTCTFASGLVTGFDPA